METERRASTRIAHEVPVLMARELDDPDVRAGTARDLSDGGACVVTESIVGIGTELYAGFFLRGYGGLPLIARVRVAWTKPQGGAHAVGLAFLCDGPAQRDAVERMRDYLAGRRRDLLAAS